MKYRTLLLLLMILPLATVVLASVGGLGYVLRRATDNQIADEFARGRHIARDGLEHRDALLRSEAQVLSQEPRLRAVLGTEDVSDETVAGVLDEMRSALQSELLLLADAHGRILSSTTGGLRPEEVGAFTSLVAAAEDAGEAVGYVQRSGRVVQVLARRMFLGSTVVGTIIVGKPIDDAFAAELSEVTGTGVVFALDRLPVAAAQVARDAADGASLAAESAVSETVSEIQVGGTRYRMAVVRARASAGPALRAVVLRSVDDARATERKLLRVLYVIGAAAIIGAFAVALHVARRLSAPMDRLVDVTREVSAGNLTPSTDVGGPYETRTVGVAIDRMLVELVRARAQALEKERLERELVIASRIQLALVPEAPLAPGLDIAAATRPAEVVGGDYFDVIPAPNGSWIAIGDVAGHGLNAGLVTLMVQSALASAARQAPDATPREILVSVNRVLHDNIRHRMKNDEHVTLTLLRHTPDGAVVFAGAHEEMIVWRAATGECERIETLGTWLGIVADVSKAMRDDTLRLERGDVLVLYSDGITEARSSDGRCFGLDGICSILVESSTAEVSVIRDRILDGVAAFRASQDDDETVVVLRQC